MVTLLIGAKGSGKTKKLIEICNKATEETKGNVVFIEKEGILIHDVSRKARLVVVDEYFVENADDFYGFISGMCAGDYDITDIIVDSTLKIIGRDFDTLAKFVSRLDKLSAAANTKIVLSISASSEELPESIRHLVQEI